MYPSLYTDPNKTAHFVCVCVCVMCKYIIHTLAKWLGLSNGLGDRVQSQVESYQRLKIVLDVYLLFTQYYNI